MNIKGMNMRMETNLKLKPGTYQIVCSECGYLLYGSEHGNRTAATLKAMELYPDGVICRNCGNEVIIEINPEDKPNKYSKDHPYY